MKAMRTHAIMAKDLVEANILIEGKNIFYSPFEERIIFPIRDHMGRCCGFGGRTFKEHDDRPKYYNSKESPHFAKGSLIFGFDAAKKAIQEKGSAFLVEGYMDCIAMAQHGYSHTVATLGTACTTEHLKLMGRHAHTVNVLYDGDNAGRKAIVRLAELCWQTNLELKVITLPDQEDPASFLLKNGSLDPLIQEAKDIFFFLLEAMGKGFQQKPLGEKLSTIRKFIGLILSIDDHLKRDILLNQAARTFDVPFDTLKQELGTVKRPHGQEEVSDHEEAITNPTDGYALEKKILAAILTNTTLLTEETELYLKTYLPTPFMHVFTKLAQAKLSQAKLYAAENPLEPVDFVQFFGTLTEEEKNMVSNIMLKGEAESSEETFKTLMRQMHKKYWRFFTLTIKKRLTEARNENNSAESVRLVEEFAAVKKSMIDSQSDYGGS
jgi:DNA primase